MERRTSVVYVLVPRAGPARIAGYYTLANASVLLKDLPHGVVKKLPRYPDVPTTLLGRLAVNKGDQGEHLGERLLLDALARSLDVSTKLGSVAVVVDAIDDGAADFYERYGFTRLPDQPRRLFLPMKNIKAALAK